MKYLSYFLCNKINFRMSSVIKFALSTLRVNATMHSDQYLSCGLTEPMDIVELLILILCNLIGREQFKSSIYTLINPLKRNHGIFSLPSRKHAYIILTPLNPTFI